MVGPLTVNFLRDTVESKGYFNEDIAAYLSNRTLFRESAKHGPLVHRPPPWTGSMDRSMDSLSWTGSMDPLFLQVEVAP